MRKRRTQYSAKEKMSYEDYIKEREQLSRGEQANYDSYEKAILTLNYRSFIGLGLQPARGLPRDE